MVRVCCFVFFGTDSLSSHLDACLRCVFKTPTDSGVLKVLASVFFSKVLASVFFLFLEQLEKATVFSARAKFQPS